MESVQGAHGGPVRLWEYTVGQYLSLFRGATGYRHMVRRVVHKKEEEAGDPLAGGIGPGGPLDPLGPVRAPPSLTAADVGFMPFKSPIDGEQAALRKPSKREMSNGVVR